MPSQPPENQGDSAPEKSIPDAQNPASHSEPPHSGQETDRSSRNTNDESRHNKPQVVDIVNIPKIDVIEGVEANKIARKANRIATDANTISKWSTAANFCLLVCTVILAIYAIVQANSSKSAAQIAQNTLDTTRKYDSINLANQKIADKKADDSAYAKFKRDTATFNLQKRSLDAQINDFKIINEPYLQIRKLNIKS